MKEEIDFEDWDSKSPAANRELFLLVFPELHETSPKIKSVISLRI